MSREDPHFRLRIPAELKEQIEAAASDEGRSINAEIVSRLTRSFGKDTRLEEATEAFRDEMDRTRQVLQSELFKALEQVSRLQLEIAEERTQSEVIANQLATYLVQDRITVPSSLYKRIAKAGRKIGRTPEEEAVLALEKAFPSPRSIDEEIELAEWLEAAATEGKFEEAEQMRTFAKRIREHAEERRKSEGSGDEE